MLNKPCCKVKPCQVFRKNPSVLWKSLKGIKINIILVDNHRCIFAMCTLRACEQRPKDWLFSVHRVVILPIYTRFEINNHDRDPYERMYQGFWSLLMQIYLYIWNDTPFYRILVYSRSDTNRFQPHRCLIPGQRWKRLRSGRLRRWRWLRWWDGEWWGPERSRKGFWSTETPRNGCSEMMI